MKSMKHHILHTKKIVIEISNDFLSIKAKLDSLHLNSSLTTSCFSNNSAELYLPIDVTLEETNT